MAALEGEDHTVTEPEREFWRSLTVVITHLSNRALTAEAEVKRLRSELQTRNEQVEYMGSTERTCATCNAVLAPGPQPAATHRDH